MNTINKVIITDCGSTTTKAILFENINGRWKLKSRGEAPTTVEKPIADVTIGVINSFFELEKNANEKLVDETKIGDKSYPLPLLFRKSKDDLGVDAYLSTSSAGGGLQMLVSGLVKSISAESAQKAALGAGAIVLDVLSEDDLLRDYERVSKIKKLKPDIFLLAGGFDGGDKKNVIEQAQLLLSAAPKPRFGNTLKLPVIYAGNKEVKKEIENVLKDNFDLQIIDNIRPDIENEKLQQAKDIIHDIFLKHVMSHSPGYSKLLSWVNIPIMPTPVAVGEMIESYGRKNNIGVLCVDIGGATTDVFSVIRVGDKGSIKKDKNNDNKNCDVDTDNEDTKDDFKFLRTVSANLGMSYSIGNVLGEAGAKKVKRWLDFEIDDSTLEDKLKNKMIRPTTLPQTLADLKIEQAIAREALRLSFIHHKSFDVGTHGFKKGKGGISNIFSQKDRKTSIDISFFDLIIGSGGVLSHSPSRLDSALIMIDAFNVRGFAELAVDSIFMLPHLGVLSKINKEASYTILENDCLIRICHAIIPKCNYKKIKEGMTLFKVFDATTNSLLGSVKKGELKNIKLEKGKKYNLKIECTYPYVWFEDRNENKKLKILNKEIIANEFGLILDGRDKSNL